MLSKVIAEDDLNRVIRFVNTFKNRCTSIAVKVPEPMRNGPANSDGWVPWTPVDSPLTNDQLADFESKLGFRFPPLFRAYLLYKCLLMTDFVVSLPETPFDDPLGPLSEYLAFRERYPSLADKQLIPFGYDCNEVGPACFDGSCKRPDGESPILIVDLGMVSDPSYRGEMCWNSFSELLDEIEADLLSFD